MDPSDGILLLIILILILLSSFFSASETALTVVNRHRLRTLSESGDVRAALVLKTLEDSEKMLYAIFIGDTIVNLSAAALAAVLGFRLGGAAAALFTGLLILLILIFGELAPKTIAAARSERLALRNIRAIRLLMRLLAPIIFCVSRLVRLYLGILRIDPAPKPDSMTEDELRSLVEESHEEGVIESEEKDMINNVFDMGDSQAKDVMVPRVSVVCLDLASTYEEILELFRKERFTRVPVYEESPDNIVGILNMKDLLLYREGTPFRIQEHLREAYFTHEFKNTYELFREMRQASVTMAIVLDEYGYMAGLITMEDMVEEIVGEIRDEFDQEELELLQKIGDREYRIEGAYKLADLNDELGTDLESEDYDSIGGYLLGLLGHFPQEGEEAEDADGRRLVTEKVHRNRIEKVRLILPKGARPLPEEERADASCLEREEETP